MNRQTYENLEAYMHGCMTDAAHDVTHIYRVLYLGLQILQSHPEANRDVFITAALLHDIGREKQAQNSQLCHAREGARMAQAFLQKQGYNGAFCTHVADCIRTHRYRSDDRPDTIEAKILFDADKLEAAGAMGMARSLIYQGQENLPLYNTDENGRVLDGTEDKKRYSGSLFMEYQRKLKRIGELLYTDAAKEMAAARGDIADRFYRALLNETAEPTRIGQALLSDALDADA